MLDKTLKLSSEQKERLTKISARQKAANEGFRISANSFAEIQTETLILKEELFKEISAMMGIDFKNLHAEGLAIKIDSDDVARIVDLKPKEEEKKEGE